MEQKVFSIKESIKWSASATWRNFGLLFLVALIPIVIRFALDLYSRFYLQPVQNVTQVATIILLGLISTTIYLVFYLGQLQLGLDIYKRGSSRFGRVLIPVKVFIFYILAGWLLGLIMASASSVLGAPLGLAYYLCLDLFYLRLLLGLTAPLIIIACFYLLTIYSLFDVALVDTGCGPIEALRTSARITCGSRLRVLFFHLALVAVVLLSVLTIVGLLFTIPMFMLARVYVYRKLKGARG